ncbi:NAD(P)/FAD-dependent oxidoreductase [Nakamurella lactea]|uniref:NAD(P)/FAD-dependent oxidoreductase n=1 Tax=Nakamurella lactea TaxID=459515 RepID=UPI000684A877|nr:FAD-dependent oxidoreductase [Nakamurella lactea]
MTQHATSVATVHPRPRIVIVGGGFVGYTVARRLARGLRAGEADVVLIDGTGVMTYQPFLPEAAGGLVEPRHLVIPLRQVLKKATVVTGLVTSIDRTYRKVHVRLPDGTDYAEDYDQLVLAPGAVPRTRPIPGLAAGAVGFGTVADAAYLRDRVLRRIALAANTDDWPTFRRALTFVVIGGGYSGVEAIGELQSMAMAAIRRYPNLKPRYLRWELIEASDEIMPELPGNLGAYARRRLTKSGISVRLNSQIAALDGDLVTLAGGQQFHADTVVWTAGVRANPLLAGLGLPVDARGRLQCDPTLRVQGDDRLWSAGDGAAVPDLVAGDRLRRDKAMAAVPLCGPTAQHAVRQAKMLARNLIAGLRGKSLGDYRHRDAGSVASLGLHRGVAKIYGVSLRGPAAWLLHRCYHLLMVPTWGRRVRVAAGWAAALLGGRDLTPLPIAVVPPYLAAERERDQRGERVA